MPQNARISWSSEQLEAFNKSKTDLADASYLAHPAPNEPLYLAADASDTAVAAVLYGKSAANGMRPLGFFSRRLNSAQLKWTLFSRELLAVYLATKHFSYFLEGSLFTIQTDHRALVRAAANAKPRESAREVRHLQYLTAMRPKLEFIAGANNNTADAISCATPPSPPPTSNDSISICSLQGHQPTINSITSSLLHRQYEALRTHQAVDKELKLLVTKQHTSQPTEELVLIDDLCCVMNIEHIRIYVPHPLRNTILHDIHDATHPGLRTTLREASRLYYWPHMRKYVSSWTKACQRCQAAKVTKHNTTAKNCDGTLMRQIPRHPP